MQSGWLPQEVFYLKILVIPDVHLKPWMFDRASALMSTNIADKALCLMDIPDNWGHELDLDLYIETFDRAISFQKQHPDTLWCYGNHDLSYIWNRGESGFSLFAWQTVSDKLSSLRRHIHDDNQIAYIHRIYNVMFMHGGLTESFAAFFAPDVDFDDADAVIGRINSLGVQEMWDEASPIWLRPQVYADRMYKEDELLQVVGHTPVEEITRDRNIISCDTFSTYRDGTPFGNCEYLLIDTSTWEYRGVK